MMKSKGGLFVLLCFWSFISCFVTVQNAYPIAYRLYDVSAKAQGQAGAYTAQADNPSAVYYNPAALPGLDGNEVLVGTEFILLETDYTNLNGVKESADNDWGIAPHLFASTHIGEKWALGVGAYSAFGLETEYNDKGLLRYVDTTSKLVIMTYSPVVAYQITPQISVGGGLDILVGSVDLRKKVDFGALAGMPGAADGDFRLKADGEAVGFNLGVMYKPHPQHQLGLVFHSPVDLEMDGKVGVVNIPDFVGVGNGVSGSASTEFDLPTILRAGYAFFPNDRWKLELDFEWDQWSNFETLEVKSQNPIVPSQSSLQDYDDSYVLAIGTDYILNDCWSVRGGYGHIWRAVPDLTFQPLIPDADRNFFTVGVSYEWKMITIDIAYQFVLFDERDIVNDVGSDIGTTVNGKYESTCHGIAIDARIVF